MKQIIPQIEAGVCLMLLEYRGTKADSLKLTDKKTGAIQDRTVLRHMCESPSEQVSVSEWLPVGSSAKGNVVPWRKGEKLILEVTSLNRSKGLLSASGTFRRLEK